MDGFESFGRMLLLLGGAIFLLGLFVILAGRIPFIGRLPGDITVRRGSFTCYMPILTSILLSILLTILLNLIFRLLNR